MKSQKTFPRTGIITLVVLLPLCLQQMALAQGNLVYNGGFDTSSNEFTPDGWTVIGGGFFEPKDGDPPPDLVLGPDVTASQTVNGLTAGDIYMVSGNYEDGGTDTTDISFEVLLNNSPHFETAVTTNLGWQSFSFEYMASSSSVDLTLWQTMGSYLSIEDYVVDNIAVYAAPEPGVLCLVAIGVIIFAVPFARRRVSGKRGPRLEKLN